MEYFSGSALKRTVDGREVLSNYLDDGEVLVGSKKIVPPQAEPDLAKSTITSIDGTNSQGGEVTEPVTPAEPAETGPTDENTLTLTEDGNSSKAAGDEPQEPAEAAEHQSPALEDQEVVEPTPTTIEEPPVEASNEEPAAEAEEAPAEKAPAAKGTAKK